MAPDPIRYNSPEYFRDAQIEPLGFREYDARWLIEPDRTGRSQLNYVGLRTLGYCFGSYLRDTSDTGQTSVVIGHDYRSYSENVKNAFLVGLLASGLNVSDVGLCTTPMLYFAQFSYSIPACAMITASHNPNGWTGVKIGAAPASTFGPTEMSAFRDFVLRHDKLPSQSLPLGSYRVLSDLRARYIDGLASEWEPRLRSTKRLRVAIETGNGTAGLAVPELLRRLGFDVVEGNTTLDWTFPHFNPDPESMPFLRAVQKLVRDSGADVGICIDGDGDRLGVIDDRARIVFSDRVGLLVARELESERGPGTVVVDVKSTSLYETCLKSRVIWEKTGHSYVKARVAQSQAMAGLERSGHFFFAPPFGRGYDDAAVAGLMLLWVMARNQTRSATLSQLLDELPKSHQSPNRQPVVPERDKYAIVDSISRSISESVAKTGKWQGLDVDRTLTINGIRIHFSGGDWLLIRASSNLPHLVIVAETFDSGTEGLRRLDEALRRELASQPAIGEFEPLYEA